jgi:hypothetical protein
LEKRCTIRWTKFGDENTKFFNPLPQKDTKEILLPLLLYQMAMWLVAMMRRKK